MEDPGRRRADHAHDGRQGLAAVRPESIEVVAVDPGTDNNAIPGRLAGIAHLGDTIQYVVRAHGGKEILGRRQRQMANKLEAGQEVWCTWGPSTPRFSEATSCSWCCPTTKKWLRPALSEEKEI